LTPPFLGKENNTTPEGCQALILDKRSPIKVPWHTLSRLIQEALKLGFTMADPPGAKPDADLTRKIKLPMGHRYYPDEIRESEARTLSWLINKYPKDCWFVSLTFEKYIDPAANLTIRWDKRHDGVKPSANRLLDMWLSRLNQAYKDITGAALLKSVVATEWQQRGVVHFHLLIYGRKLGNLSRKRWESRWAIIGGGFATIYEAENEAASYLVKHEIKNRAGGNLDLGGSWRGISPPRSLDVCHRSAASKSLWGVVKASHRADRSTTHENSCQLRPG